MKMSENKNRARQKYLFQISELDEMTLITIIALLFLLLHILAGTLLQRSPASEIITPQEKAQPSLYD
jgi:hypothetical protein